MQKKNKKFETKIKNIILLSDIDSFKVVILSHIMSGSFLVNIGVALQRRISWLIAVDC